ncbi:hypothetical protein HH214_05060 [Mucilaginibacter robiniae]|uniref:Uncharacterized protein n=1 Tax=Mucilaginibacter robiniae TaxID=2728022 RepID=A0A7L5DW14_9SPHI|nr:hypothetical protein [Mucilaginibacter robiniae]QJD95285.1 hypothetical protein HH214_05060 [Mucilaginibacter robiniae]
MNKRRSYFLPLCVLLGFALGIASRHLAAGVGIGTAVGLLVSRNGNNRNDLL